MKELELQKQYHIGQVIATMAIEVMPIDSQTLENLKQIINGITREYINGQYILLSRYIYPKK